MSQSSFLTTIIYSPEQMKIVSPNTQTALFFLCVSIRATRLMQQRFIKDRLQMKRLPPTRPDGGEDDSMSGFIAGTVDA